MCGRFAHDDHSPEAEAWREATRAARRGMRRYFELLDGRSSFDVRPSQVAPILIGDQAVDARWGWPREFVGRGGLINARWETAGEKRTFSEAVRERRCAIPATAYYEWQRDHRDRPIPNGKHAFRARDGGWLAMAGLWERVDDEIRFLVLTRPMTSYADIHDRTPVMLSTAAEEAWLDPAARQDDILAAAASLGDRHLVVRPVISGPNAKTPAGQHLLASTGEPWPW